jgi:hypothetical protein
VKNIDQGQPFRLPDGTAEERQQGEEQSFTVDALELSGDDRSGKE